MVPHIMSSEDDNQKHDDYNYRTEIVLTKHDDKFYTLEYTSPNDERYELYGTKYEVVAELVEHMNLMKTKGE